ncbi:MAG: winged helix family transcriptional regulator, partial [Moraxellaceae bacterium]
ITMLDNLHKFYADETEQQLSIIQDVAINNKNIFEQLMRRYPDYISFHDLAETVWQNDSVDDNTIRTQIYSLRKILDKNLEPGLIKSVHGLGYRLTSAS